MLARLLSHVQQGASSSYEERKQNWSTRRGDKGINWTRQMIHGQSSPRGS